MSVRDIDMLRAQLANGIAAFAAEHEGHAVVLHDVRSVPEAELEACFHLVRDNLRDVYERSSWGWKPAFKEAELREEPTKYLLVHATTGAGGRGPLGFLSCQVVDEAGEAVLYLYEVQLVPEIRGRGIGSHLVRLMHDLARANGVGRAMLTVFRANREAFALYERLGYTVDDTSPPDVMLRGRMVQADYAILTKTL